MAKEVRFNLEMKDGIHVADVEGLRDHYSVRHVREYYNDGRLMDWLVQGFYSEEADLIKTLDKDDPELDLKLCEIFDVGYFPEDDYEGEIGGRVLRKYEGEYIVCECGNEYPDSQIVCNKCGKMIGEVPYKAPNEHTPLTIDREDYPDIFELSTLIAERNWSEGSMKYKETKKELDTVRKIAAISRSRMKDTDEGDLSVYRWIYRKCRKFISETENKAVEVAVVGNVKSGKSSLINALLGGKMASVDPTPETSVLVKYRATDEKNYLKVGFYSEIEWSRLWNSVKKASTKSGNIFENEYKRLGSEKIRNEYIGHKTIYAEASKDAIYDEIYKWTCSESPEHFFVKEVEVGYQGEVFPKDVVLVDTPGLRDPIEFRSRITRNYITKSDWVLACITSDNLSSQDEADFLCKVVANKKEINNILVVATKKDMLTDSANSKKQDEFIRRMAPIYGSVDNVKKHFVDVSSELFSFSDRTRNGERLQQEEMQTMVQGLVKLNIFDFSSDSVKSHWREIDSYAGVSALLKRINDLFLTDRRRHMIKEIKWEYSRLIKNIHAKVEERLTEENHDLTLIIDRSVQSEGLRKELQRDLDELEIQRKKVIVLIEQIATARKPYMAEEV